MSLAGEIIVSRRRFPRMTDACPPLAGIAATTAEWRGHGRAADACDFTATAGVEDERNNPAGCNGYGEWLRVAGTNSPRDLPDLNPDDTILRSGGGFAAGGGRRTAIAVYQVTGEIVYRQALGVPVARSVWRYQPARGGGCWRITANYHHCRIWWILWQSNWMLGI